jgi:hypothetical protein
MVGEELDDGVGGLRAFGVVLAFSSFFPFGS